MGIINRLLVTSSGAILSILLGLACTNAVMAKTSDSQATAIENDAYRMGKGCPKVGSLASPSSTKVATIKFTDNIASERAASIYWIDFKGNLVEMGIFKNGEASFNSYAGHIFIVKDFDGTCYGGSYTLKAGHNEFSVSENSLDGKEVDANIQLGTNIDLDDELGAGDNTRPAKCLLQVNGKKYIDGTCKYSADKDGSFRLYGKQYFVYLNVFEKGKAGASWNADPQSTHAQAPLGELKQKGACWTNKTTKICAWNKKQSKKKSKQIKFARGAFSSIQTGKLNNFDSEQSYTIGVSKGQTLSVEQIDKQGDRYISIYVAAPNGENVNDMDLSCHSNATISPTVAGNYTIKVVECSKADPWKGRYSLKVTVK